MSYADTIEKISWKLTQFSELWDWKITEHSSLLCTSVANKIVLWHRHQKAEEEVDPEPMKEDKLSLWFWLKAVGGGRYVSSLSLHTKFSFSITLTR